MKTCTLILVVVLTAISLDARGQAEQGKTIQVRCADSYLASLLGAPPDPLNRALRMARPGDTLLISGTCRESITITSGPLTLRSQKGGAISGSRFDPGQREFNGLVTIDGARGVTIDGLEIRDSQAEGVLLINGAGASIENAVVRGNRTGIRLSQSTLAIADSEVRDQAGSGIMAISGSSLVMTGNVNIHNNLGAGLFLEGNVMAELRGARVHVDDNVLGVVISLHSTLAVLELETSVGSVLTARNNAAIGIQLGQGVLMVAGEGRPVASSLIDSSNNGGPGLVAVAGSQVLSPFGAARFVFDNNPVGMVLMTNSSTEIRGGLQVQDNAGPGIVASGAGVIMLRSVPDPDHPVPSDQPSPSTIGNNAGPAVIADFGTRLDIRAVEVSGPVICDPTVISTSGICQ